MNNYCSKCGEKLEENVAFCSKCGAKIKEDRESYNGTTLASSMVEKKEIAIEILLTIITCGIYGLFWLVRLTDDANRLSEETNTSGGMVLLFSILTCGIYLIYWSYKMGKNLEKAGQIHGIQINDNSTIYLILCIFGFGIINYCIMQNDINKFA